MPYLYRVGPCRVSLVFLFSGFLLAALSAATEGSTGSAVRVPAVDTLVLAARSAGSAGTVSGSPSAEVSGRVSDPKGGLIPGARVKLAELSGRFERTVPTDRHGVFRFEGLLTGNYRVTVSNTGFTPVTRTVSLQPGEQRRMDFGLELAMLTEEMVVSAPRIGATSETIPGSVSIVDSATLQNSRVFTTSEALRKVAGVNVRDEEGFGLRPNIGIRGVNPTRSTKVLLLEDGIPLSYAPYGDNASYYHPPIDRFESIEVLKGAGQILYGPATVSGVVNYITPLPPNTPSSGSVTLIGGNRDYLNSHLNWGGTWGATGLLVDFTRKQGEGARENQRFGLSDVNLKLVTTLSPRQAITFKGNYYGEDSNVTYSGLTEEEYAQNPRQNPFRNDFFYGDRYGASASHSIFVSDRATLTTNLYAAVFKRHWWRQSSNSNERPNHVANPLCGGMENLNTTCGNQGRLRRYRTWGVEPHIRLTHRLFGLKNESDFGFRIHFEDQNRRQENGTTPQARTGILVENNSRKNHAYSVFLQNRFAAGRFAFTPGARLERISYQRTNRLANDGAGVSGRTELTQVVPGFGMAYSARNDLTLFAGIHRGFAPPRTEDVINNLTGGAIDLDPELSWNYEVGLRGRLHPAAGIEAALFRIDYENQIVPASLAGGVGALLTNGGQTLHQGAEFSGRFDLGTALATRQNVYLRSAYTYLPIADFTGPRFSAVSGFSDVRITGNRLPYAPQNLVTTTLGYLHPRGLDALIENVYIGKQFGDDLNTIAATPNGQRGIIPAQTIWNAAVNYQVESLGTTFFLSVKNLLDRVFIIDRTRGILPSGPRWVQVGVRFDF
jgi:Fe(3+) dicitrate transport protein